MPQTYSVTTSPRAAGTSSPDAVSRTRTSGALPGTSGTNGIGQLLTRRLYPAVRARPSRAPGPRTDSQWRPGHRRPVAPWGRVHPAVDEARHPQQEGVDVGHRQQHEQAVAHVADLERTAKALEAREVGVHDRFTRPAPQHRA